MTESPASPPVTVTVTDPEDGTPLALKVSHVSGTAPDVRTYQVEFADGVAIHVATSASGTTACRPNGRIVPNAVAVIGCRAVRAYLSAAEGAAPGKWPVGVESRASILRFANWTVRPRDRHPAAVLEAAQPILAWASGAASLPDFQARMLSLVRAHASGTDASPSGMPVEEFLASARDYHEFLALGLPAASPQED